MKKDKKKVEKTYPLSLEDVEIIAEANAMGRLRDRYTRRWGSYKNAKKAAIECIKLEIKFWARVNELYPKLAEEQHLDPNIIGLVFNQVDNTIAIHRREA